MFLDWISRLECLQVSSIRVHPTIPVVNIHLNIFVIQSVLARVDFMVLT